jgi:long-subunit acyl-CoA synthetase (AMP-forming)
MIRGQYCICQRPLGRIEPTVGAMLAKRASRWKEHAIFASKDESGNYVPISWSDFFNDMSSLAIFLTEKGIRKGDRIAVFSPNGYQMLVWEMTVTSMGATSVPIFHGYDHKNVAFILNHAEPKAIYIDGDERLEKVTASDSASSIPLIVTKQKSSYNRIDDCFKAPDREFLSGLIKKAKPSDICFIQYTSGTTGNPKGVMLTHRNIMSQRKGMSQVWDIQYKSRFLSYLPWHHSFGGLFERFAALYHGATIHLEDSFGKDIKRLIQNWSKVRPTQFFSVPKIYIALVTEARASEEARKTIFHPELKFVFTAAAPLPKDCADYFREQNVPVVEGWGLTETSPLVTFTNFGVERVEGCVGEPIAGCEILITEDDEILTRGPNLMKGYFKDEERTKRVIDPLGWFHTGDVGELLEDGLKITCRADDLFKLSNGEKVSSMLVENAMVISSRWIQHALAIGSGEDFVSALVFLNHRSIERWASEKGKTLQSGWELSKDGEIQELIANEISKNMAEFQPKYMRVKAFVIIPTELSIEGGELTPTMKVIRHRVLEKYHEWCTAIYRPHADPDKLNYIVSIK